MNHVRSQCRSHSTDIRTEEDARDATPSTDRTRNRRSLDAVCPSRGPSSRPTYLTRAAPPMTFRVRTRRVLDAVRRVQDQAIHPSRATIMPQTGTPPQTLVDPSLALYSTYWVPFAEEDAETSQGKPRPRFPPPPYEETLKRGKYSRDGSRMRYESNPVTRQSSRGASTVVFDRYSRGDSGSSPVAVIHPRCPATPKPKSSAPFIST